MPRRPGRTPTTESARLLTPDQIVSQTQSACLKENLPVLRTKWKWAAFSQFITTFSPLLNMADVTVTDVENDLASGSKKAVSRVMQRLLYTLSYDRKISPENWQSALRKQYMKRDPLSNPLGPEPPKEQGMVDSREETPDPHGARLIQEDPDTDPSDIPSKRMGSEPKILLDQSATTSEVSRAATQEVENAGSGSNGNQAPLDWFDLPMLTKLDSLHLLTEWQFQNPTRLRTLMRSDDELATWRHEPIGYDSKRNAYWLIGGDRLWIQRVPPCPPKPLKRKWATESRTISEPSKLSKRPRTKAALTSSDGTSKVIKQGRAAKMQAKIRLDAQAKELAEMNRQAKLQTTRTSNRTSTRSFNSSAKAVSRPLGTRVSARLRGTQVSEWQPMPDDWLDDSVDPGWGVPSDDNNKDSQESNQARGDDHHDSISELTELSDESDSPDSPPQKPTWQREFVEPSASTSIDNSVQGEEPEEASPDQFVEWETICVVLEDWEHIAERFEKATHYLEKALYKYLTTEIVPGLTQMLKETERKRRMDEALVHRKRSSRIAMKESEREEARLTAQRQAAEEEKMGRARRLEARRQREEEERLRREQAREQRRKEREVRELRRRAESEEQEDYTNGVEEQQDSKPSSKAAETPPAHTKTRRNGKTQDWSQHPRAAKPGDWELDCEICGKRGVNLDDGTPMMSCGMCFKWQHIRCHDEADQRGGRSKRNWDVVEFICQQCRSKMFERPGTSNTSLGDPRPHRQSQGGNLQPPYHDSTPYQTYLPQSYGGAGLPSPSTIPALYHAPNGNYSHYTQPRGNIRTVGTSDHYPASSPSFVSMHHYGQPPTTISFSHYQPQEGGFSSNTKAQPLYTDAHGRHLPSTQHVPYSDLRSSARAMAPSPTQTVWNITTPATASSHATPYQSGMHNAAISRREAQSGPSLPELNRTSYHVLHRSSVFVFMLAISRVPRLYPFTI